MEKCISCEEKVNIEEDYYNYTCDDQIICEDCYNSDLEHPIVIFDNKNRKYYKGEYTFINEDGESDLGESGEPNIIMFRKEK